MAMWLKIVPMTGAYSNQGFLKPRGEEKVDRKYYIGTIKYYVDLKCKIALISLKQNINI